MQESYADVIEDARVLFLNAILSREPDLETRARDVDRLLLVLLRELGRLVMESVIDVVGESLTEEGRRNGLTVHRRLMIWFWCLFGRVCVASPYLYDRRTRRRSHPVRDRMQVTHEGRSVALERALKNSFLAPLGHRLRSRRVVWACRKTVRGARREYVERLVSR